MLPWTLLSCAPAPAPAPPPDIVLLTAEDSLAPAVAVRLPGGVLTDAVPAGRSLRSSLATLLTGRLPPTHGVRDPVLHAPAVPTFADHLAAHGWAVEAEPGELLHPGEDWGFGRPGGPGRFTWLHGEAHLETAVARHREGNHLVVVGLGEEAPLYWVGPGIHAFPERIGQVDVVATLAAASGVDVPTDGVDLRRASAGTLYREDARGLAVGLGIVGPDGVSGNEAPVREAPVDPVLVDRWEAGGALVGDLRERGRPVHPERALELLEAVEVELRAGRLTRARDRVEELEGRFGPSGATRRLRNRIVRRTETPRGRLEDLVGAQTAEDRLRVARLCLDLLDFSCAEQVTGDLLANWSDHSLARYLRARASRLAGREALDDEAWLSVHAPRFAALLDLEDRLDDGGVPRIDATLAEVPEAALLRSRVAWAAGDVDTAVDRLDAMIRASPFRIEPRRWRARWALTLGDPHTVLRLTAPLRGTDEELDALYAGAVEQLRGERERVESLRASWRQEGR